MRVLLPFVVGCVLAAPPAHARPADGDGARSALAADLSAGRIDRETWLVQSFRYAFAPDRLDTRYRPAEHTKLRCFTPEVAEFHRVKATLSAAAVAEIEGYLHPQRSGLRAVYISPGGKFQLTYDTAGTNAVPLTDVNPANGTPDFVERCAEYMDYSWAQEIDTIGFVAPTLPGDGTYDIGFENMPGTYGYTSPVGFSLTEIVLENNFVGFPANTDPDGTVLGAAKVTCAHEFKHASQYTTSGWTEGGWVELDATWAEDIVYPATNDYWNYVSNNGPNVLGQPWTPLDNTGAGSYEDCLWETYMSSQYGIPIIVDLWEIRDANPGQTMKASYGDALALYGSNWEDGYTDFLEFAWFTGSRAETGFGFPDAASIKRMNLRTGSAVAAYPYNTSDNVNQLSGNPYRFNQGTATGTPRIQFDGVDGTVGLTLSVILKETAGGYTIVRPTLDANNVCDYTSPLPWSALEYVGVIAVNTLRNGGNKAYTLNVLDETAVGAPVIAATVPSRLLQAPPTPNPTRESATVHFSLPRASHASVRILDVAGRVVRILVDRDLPAGAHESKWDGRDAAGRAVASGIYWSRVESGDSSVTRKVTLLR